MPGQQLTRRQLLLLYGVVFLYAACFMAQAPLLPYIVKQLGLDMAHYGKLQSMFSALQLVGGLLSGPLVDRYGGRVLLMLSFAFSALCYVLTATATSIQLLLLSRLATLMQHAVLAARTLVTHSSSSEERAALIGRIGACYGLGFAVGPALGGLLSSVSLPATAWAAAGGSLLALAIVYLGLPADAPPAARSAASKDGSSSESPAADAPRPQQPPPPRLSLASLASITTYRGVPALLLMQAGANLAGAMMHSTFALVLQQRYELSSKQNGLVMSWVGVCVVVGQAGVIRPLSARVGEAAAVRAGVGFLTLAFLGLGLSTRLWQLLLCLIPLAFSTVIVSTLNTARLSRGVPNTLAGTAMSVDMSIASGLRTVAPIIGSAAYQRGGFPAVCGLAAAALVCSATAAAQLQQPPPSSSDKQRAAACAGGGSKKQQ